MRNLIVGLAALISSGCVTLPFQQGVAPTPAAEDPNAMLIQARARESQLRFENAALQQQIDRLARELGEANAKIKVLDATIAASRAPAAQDGQPAQVETPEPAPKADGARSPAARSAAPAGTTSSGQTIHTGPRGGKYVITPSGNKRYLPRR